MTVFCRTCGQSSDHHSDIYCREQAIKDDVRPDAVSIDEIVKQTSFNQPKLQAMRLIQLIETGKPLTLASEQAAVLKNVLVGYISALDYFEALLKR